MLLYCVEDDANIRELILYTLKMAGYKAEGFAEGKSFFQALSHVKPDFVLLDIMLPEEDGISILQKLREDRDTRDLPVIMITAKSSEVDKVIGLDNGADDYLVKPFGMMEMVSRIKAVARRSVPEKDGAVLYAHGIRVNKEKHEVVVKDEKIELTLKEYEVLSYLMENIGLVVTRDQLLEKIWGYNYMGETRTVDVHIRSLRQKLGEAGQSIQTVRGVGYRMEETNET